MYSILSDNPQGMGGKNEFFHWQKNEIGIDLFNFSIGALLVGGPWLCPGPNVSRFSHMIIILRGGGGIIHSKYFLLPSFIILKF